MRNILETPKNLFVAPVYRGTRSIWDTDFNSILKHESDLSWDASAILSILTYGYAVGDSTLLEQIKRQPWLSTINPDQTITLGQIPPHGLRWVAPEVIANRLKSLLLDEAEKVCYGRNEIYVLLSGGLDSRIIAAILVELFKQGRIASKPISVTWGLENSRDVVYARLVAKFLEIENIHVPLTADDLLNNISLVSERMAGLVSPVHLHAMSWFKNVDSKAIVLNGSYGDSIGRAEFSKKHILELNFHTPPSDNLLLTAEVFYSATTRLNKELMLFRERNEGQQKFAICENEMQGHYMRGLIGYSMSMINHDCAIYNMFTSPDVYTYIWSIHPSARTDKVYLHLLEKINPDLSVIPWARTNKSVSGKTRGARKNLLKDFHIYNEWIVGDLKKDVLQFLDPEWFRDTGLFDMQKIGQVRNNLYRGKSTLRIDALLWLCAFRGFSDTLNRTLTTEIGPIEMIKTPDNRSQTVFGKIRGRLNQIEWLYKFITYFRKRVLRYLALLNFPPILE